MGWTAILDGLAHVFLAAGSLFTVLSFVFTMVKMPKNGLNMSFMASLFVFMVVRLGICIPK
jgi:hypothetical protein